MDVLSNLFIGFQTALTLKNIYLCFIGCLWGTVVGVLPGIGPLAGITLLIPATFGIDATGAIIMLAGIYYGAMYGGSTTSILMNIPGESASVVTCLDGYQMAHKGRGGAALFIAAWGSWIGGTLSIVGLMFLAPFLANFAVKFGPPEMFALLLIAFILLGSLGKGSFFKTVPMILLGLLIGTVGMDPLTGTMRFTHGIKDLYDGIGFIPVAMGAFGIGEILTSTEESLVRFIGKIKMRELLPNREELRASWGPIFRGTGLGFLIGLLPGSAHVLSSFVSYTVEKRLAKKPEEFGTGRVEGVAGPETANNAASESAMIPFLGLGIPTGPAPAVMMIALLIHGVRPGPLFISEQPQVFWGLIASMYIGNVILIILNLPLVGLFVNLLRVPFRILFPVILLICLVGTYSVNSSVVELVILLFFGVLGYIFRKLDFDIAPFILAMIIGPTLEMSFRQSLMRSAGSFSIFFKSPIACTLIVLSCLLFIWNILRAVRPKKAWERALEEGE
ncbi:MAG TPA: tripartite tricarboxylate transporter permease [Thermodesulfobacteriota bacterium]|nr:tripartite tricarboxylate transporter permease [Thermodesulfobacteriota bacterium]